MYVLYESTAESCSAVEKNILKLSASVLCQTCFYLSASFDLRIVYSDSSRLSHLCVTVWSTTQTTVDRLFAFVVYVCLLVKLSA